MFWFSGPRHVGSQLPDQGLNPTLCTRRQSLHHWTTREVPGIIFKKGEGRGFALCLFWITLTSYSSDQIYLFKMNKNEQTQEKALLSRDQPDFTSWEK